MQIDKNSHIPLFRQVEQVLEEKIVSGEWGVGSQLPTEQELASIFNVSTITVKRSIIELVNKGYLFRQRGKGTFVLGDVKEKDINSFISLTTEKEVQHPHELISFSVENADNELAKKMKIQSDSKVTMIKRLKIEGNEPMALEYIYLPYASCPDLTPNDINYELIYNVLKDKFKIPLGRAKMFIKPFIVLDDMASLLRVEPGTPVFEWERFTYTKQEEIIEYSKFYVRQDKETYYTEMFFHE